jgi:hypothetical protein
VHSDPAAEQEPDVPGFYDALARAPEADLSAEYARLGLDPGYDLLTDPLRLNHLDGAALRGVLPRTCKRYDNETS